MRLSSSFAFLCLLVCFLAADFDHRLRLVSGRLLDDYSDDGDDDSVEVSSNELNVVHMIPKRVVIHKRSAIVHSEASVHLPAGYHVLTIPRLVREHSSNASVEEDSFVADGGQDLLIENVEWGRERNASLWPFGEDTVEAVEDQIEKLQVTVQELQAGYDAAARSRKLLNQVMERRDGPQKLDSAATDPVLILKHYSAELGEIIKKKTKELESQLAQHRKKLRDLKKQMKAMTHREIVARVYVNALRDGEHTVRTMLLVGEASWQPRYDLEVNTKKGLITARYGAIINHAGSMDWNNVTLHICAGEPSVDRKTPDLKPFVLEDQPMLEAGNQQQQQQHKALLSKRSHQSAKHYNQAAMGQPVGDENADEFRHTEHNVEQGNDGSTVYVLPGLHTVRRGHNVRAIIAKFSLNSKLTYTAVPKKSTRVFVGTTIMNTSPYTMLPGKAIVFADGRFLSSTTIPLLPTGTTASMDLGVQSDVLVSRRLVHHRQTTTGGLLSKERQEQDIMYEIAIQSLRNVPMEITVRDQVPTTHTERYRVNLLSPKHGAVDPHQEETISVGNESDDQHNQQQSDNKKDVSKIVTTLLSPDGVVEWTASVQPQSTFHLRLRYGIAADGETKMPLLDL